MNKVVMLLASIILSSGCEHNAHDSSQAVAASMEEVKQIVAGYPEAVRQKDLEWFSNFWSNEKDFVFAFDGQISNDYDQWFNTYYREGLSGLKRVLRFNFSNGHASALSDHIITYATNFDWAVITVSGDTVESKGAALYVFKKKEDGKWSVVNAGGTHIYY